MIVARRTRAPRCGRCGRVTAPYSICLPCSSRAESDLAAPATIEDLIADALPGEESYRLEDFASTRRRPEDREPATELGYDPEDVAIPRDSDVFLGAGRRWRRHF